MRNNIILMAMFAFIFAIYVYTLAPSVPLQGDAGELITVAYTLGIAHPPGYPLYTLLGHLFSLIPINSVAWRLNLFSAVCQLLTIFVVYKIVRKLTNNFPVSIFSAVILAFSQIFWLYALVAEVFALNNLISAIFIYFTIKYSLEAEKTSLPKQVFLLALIFGLGLSNHHTIIFVGFPAIYLLWPNIKKLHPREVFVCVAAGTVGLILGLSSYLYILIRAKTSIVPVAWNYPEDLKSLVELFLRKDYGTFSPLLGYEPAVSSLGKKLDQVAIFFRFFWQDFLFPAAGVMIFGLFSKLKKITRPEIFLILSFFTSGPLFLIYANFPVWRSDLVLAVVERFYLLPYIILAILLGVQLNRLSGLLTRLFALRLVIIPGLIIWVVAQYLLAFPNVSQRNNYLGLEFGKNILKSVPKDGLLFPQGDVGTFTVFYARYVENFRSDVELLPPNVFGPLNSMRYLKKVRPDINFSSDNNFVALNLNSAKIVHLGPPPSSYDGFVASPSGLLYKFFPVAGLASSSEFNQSNLGELTKYNLPDEKYFHNRNLTIADSALLAHYSYVFLLIGDVLSNLSDFKSARFYYEKSSNFEPFNPQALSRLGNVYAKLLECETSREYYEKVLKLNKFVPGIYYSLEQLASSCFHDTQLEKYYRNLRESVGPIEGDLKNL